jgi:hypothetical protein
MTVEDRLLDLVNTVLADTDLEYRYDIIDANVNTLVMYSTLNDKLLETITDAPHIALLEELEQLIINDSR